MWTARQAAGSRPQCGQVSAAFWAESLGSKAALTALQEAFAVEGSSRCPVCLPEGIPVLGDPFSSTPAFPLLVAFYPFLPVGPDCHGFGLLPRRASRLPCLPLSPCNPPCSAHPSPHALFPAHPLSAGSNLLRIHISCSLTFVPINGSSPGSPKGSRFCPGNWALGQVCAGWGLLSRVLAMSPPITQRPPCGPEVGHCSCGVRGLPGLRGLCGAALPGVQDSAASAQDADPPGALFLPLPPQGPVRTFRTPTTIFWGR